MARPEDLDRFYSLLGELAQQIGGPRKLKNCTGRMDWPERGVYFFLEPGERKQRANWLRSLGYVERDGTSIV